MKTRIISGIGGILLLIAAVALNNIVFSILVTIIAIIGIYEYTNSLASAGYKPLKTPGYIACLGILAAGTTTDFGFPDPGKALRLFAALIFLTIITLFIVIIFSNIRYSIVDISLTFFGIFYIAFLFSFIVLTRNMNGGRYYIWLVFIGAFATDTFAYFCGRFFGKRKILPVISPKKTLEGSIGGIIGCIIVMTLYRLLLPPEINSVDSISVLPMYHFVILGLLCGIISQIGDWSASAIKRYVKIKDFGNIMPGHGGVLDRLDSVLFTAPVIYFYIKLLA